MQTFKGDKPSEETVAEKSGESVPFLKCGAWEMPTKPLPKAETISPYNITLYALLWMQYISNGNKELLIVHKTFCTFFQVSFLVT
jgi:hypothetical protein